MSPLRVGLVSPYDLSKWGGVQAQVLGLARHLQETGDEPLVIGPGLPEGLPGIDLGRSISIPANGSKVPLSLDPRSRAPIRDAGKTLDLLHVHEPLMPLVSWFATHAGPPVVATFHANPGRIVRTGYRLGRPLFQRLMGRTVAVTAVSETAMAALPPLEGVQVIPNAIDTAFFDRDVPRSPRRVVFLGRDEPRKGLNVLLAAWRAVSARHPDAELTVIGASRDDGRATWLGRVGDEQKAEVLASSSVYVAPQTGGESFGIVLVEAMAAGCAVVASDLVPFREVAKDIACFFPAGDSAALAAALIELLDRPDRVEELRQAGRQRSAAYDWSVIGPAYRRVYDIAVS